MPESQTLVSAREVSVVRSKNLILRSVSLEIDRGDPYAIVGESGSGKTTFLYAVLGLLPVQQGSITVLSKSIESLSPRSRADLVGLVFQDYQLFPHLTVMQNILLAPQLMKRTSVDEAKALTLLDELRIKSLAERYSHQLSGGQKQRVAIARSLILEPKILFFDEPSAALDAKTTEELADLLKGLNTRTQVIVVSHDRPFIERCCTRGAKFESGGVTAQGSVASILSS